MGAIRWGASKTRAAASGDAAGVGRRVADGPARRSLRQGLRGVGLACAALMALTSAAGAAGIPTRSMSCAQAAALVKQKGAVLLATSANAYDRYVNDRRFCEYDQELKAEWVPTRDVAQCFIGYICYEPARNGGNRGN